MELNSAVYLEVNLIGIFFPLLILLDHSRESDQQADNLAYCRTAKATLAILLADILWPMVNGRSGTLFLICNGAINSLYMFLTGLIPYLWLQYVFCRLQAAPKKHSARQLLTALPLMLLLAMSVLSPWTHWLFEIGDGNLYVRGPLIAVQQLVGYGYGAAATFFTLSRAKSISHPEKRAEVLTFGSFVILPAVGGVINMLSGLPTIWPLAAVSLMMVHMRMQRFKISTDELTGLNNRRQFNRYLESMLEEPQKDVKVYLLLLDVDDFKQVNDTYGHVEGDRALGQTASLLKSVCSTEHCFLARYGGDEFAIVLHSADDLYPQRLQRELRDVFDRFNSGNTQLYRLTISIGVGTCSSPECSVSELIDCADKALYRAKSEKKCR